MKKRNTDTGEDPENAGPAEQAEAPGREEVPERDPAEVKRGVEALIFVSPGGVGQKRLAEVLECGAGDVQRAVTALRDEYRERGSGLDILPVAGGFQLVTVSEVSPAVEKLLTVARKKHLSQPAMETLAIIAYRQPVTKPEIEAIRGVDSSGVINGLLDKKLVRLAGRRKAPGKPLLYATSREFLVHFGLKDLRELPALAELGAPPLADEEMLPLEDNAPEEIRSADVEEISRVEDADSEGALEDIPETGESGTG